MNKFPTKTRYSNRRFERKEVENVKKVLLGVAGTAGVIAGILIIWKAVIPFIWMVITGFFLK